MYQKLSPEENILLFGKIPFFPMKNHSAFIIRERYDIERTNIKIPDKNMTPGGAQVPERRLFLLLFLNFTDFGIKC